MAAAADNVYVSGLPEGVDEESFQSIFAGFGTIVSSKVFTDRKYGFVRYSSAEEAKAAIDSMNGKDYQGSELAVKLSEPRQRYDWMGWGGKGGGTTGAAETPASDNLYMKGLPKSMSEDKIREIFNAYGAVAQVRILNTGASEDTVALVRMEALDKAQWIVANLNGNIPQGLDKAIFVKFADSSQIKWQKQAHKSMQHWQEWGWLWASLSKGGGKGYGWGGGYGKGKGKGGRRPRGPDLPREKVTEDLVTGEVLEWKGKYGWIKPAAAIDHASASKNEGKIFISMSDLPEGVTELEAGASVKFKVFSDSAGLGAEECVAA